MKVFAIMFFTLCFSVLQAQEFSFKMKFVDSIGNTDSLILGYDSTATDQINPTFGESNISNEPYLNDLDVRVITWDRYRNDSAYFESKKKIINYHCSNIHSQAPLCHKLPLVGIGIKTDFFPVTVYWDKHLFSDTCRNGSLFTSVPPGGWWDVSGFIDTLLTKDSSTIFPNTYNYLTNDSGNVYIYWLAFYDSTVLMVGIDDYKTDEHSFNIAPNPSSYLLNIVSKQESNHPESLELYNTMGQLIIRTTQLKNIDISNVPSGLYFVKLLNKNSSTILKFQKE